MGRLTTHVLDTASGAPAAGLLIALRRLDVGENQAGTLLGKFVTNADGRVDKPLLQGGKELIPAIYELEFSAGDYLRKRGISLSDPAFLDVIPIRFGISDPKGHYHVPLLLSPYGYSTYRGS